MIIICVVKRRDVLFSELARKLRPCSHLDQLIDVRMSTNHLRHGSAVLEQLIQNDGLLVVGAEYSLETGIVEFFDGVPKPL